jgi:RNA polymerase sigma-70 factor, ECF subfamily
MHMPFRRKCRIIARVSHAEELHPPAWPAGHPCATGARESDTVLRAAQSGDEDAFRTLYRAINPRLLNYARTLVGDDAEDVTSEAWLHIARDIASFDGDIDGFRGWTATIARHRALDHLRHRKRRPVSPTSVGDMPEPAALEDTETIVLDSLSTEAAITLIARLPRDQAEIIILRVVVGLDAKAVAKILDKRPGAVRTAAHRGLRRLERFLTDLEPPR